MAVSTDDRWAALLAGASLGAVGVLAAVDLTLDLVAGVAGAHVVVELCIALVGGVGAVVFARRWRGLRRAVAEARRRGDVLEERLAASRAEAERWRAEARALIEGLGAAIERQFERWALSPAEAEVALLMLKGLSHKEIAQARAVGEATVRQQARAVYRKAGVDGRHGLMAFFLEDLILPSGGAGPGA